MSQNNTVNVPGGPAYVFGKKNLAYTGSTSAHDNPLEGGSDYASSDFVSEDEEDPEEQAYDEAYDKVGDAFDDIELDTSSRFVHFTDADGTRMDYDTMRNDYAYQVSVGDDPDDLKMVLSFANTGDEFNDAVNAESMELKGGRTRIRGGWDVTDDNDVIIPVKDVVDGYYASDIKEYTDAVNFLENDGPILSDSVAQKIETQARENSVSDIDISSRINDMADSDLQEHIYSLNEDLSEEEEREFLEEKINDYQDRVNESTLAQAIGDMLYDGSLDQSDLDYDGYTNSYHISQSDIDSIVSRALEDN